MIEPGRKFVQGVKKYRHGFNGEEKDNEVSGDGNQYDYGFRIYDPRLGRFLSVDPLISSYPWYTPYQFAGNNPIISIDLDGLEGKVVITDQYVEAFKRKYTVNCRNVDDAVKQGMTVIMHLTIGDATNNTSKDVIINNGFPGSDIMSFPASVGFGGNVEWGGFSYATSALMRKISDPVEPITFDNSYTAGLLPRSSPSVKTAIEGERKGIKTIHSEMVYNEPVLSYEDAIKELPNTGFKGYKDEFKDTRAAMSAITGYVSGLPAGTKSITFTITVTDNEKSGAKLMQWRKDLMEGIMSRLTTIPILFDLKFDPEGGNSQHLSATAVVPVVTSSTTVKGYNVTTQPVKQKTINGRGVGPVQNSGSANKPTFQNTPPAANGSIEWGKKKG